MEGLSLREKIEFMRELMVNTATKKGLNASETIEVSRKLDALMNQYDISVSQRRNEIGLHSRRMK